LLSPSCRPDLERARHLLELHAVHPAPAADTSDAREANPPTRNIVHTTNPSIVAASSVATLRCPVCEGATLTLVNRFKRSRAPPWPHAARFAPHAMSWQRRLRGSLTQPCCARRSQPHSSPCVTRHATPCVITPGPLARH
jgi:hypothetical protein